MYKYILIAIFIFNSSLCEGQVKFLEKNEKAPYRGYLFSESKELETRTKINDYDRIILLSKKQDEYISILENRSALQMEINDNLRKQNQNIENTTMTEKMLWFAAGVLLTGTGAYLLQRK